MKRKIYDNLIIWKNRPDRKPLIIEGARQVGKTYIVEEFGKNEFEKYAYFNFVLVDYKQNEIIEDIPLYAI